MYRWIGRGAGELNPPFCFEWNEIALLVGVGSINLTRCNKFLRLYSTRSRLEEMRVVSRPTDLEPAPSRPACHFHSRAAPSTCPRWNGRRRRCRTGSARQTRFVSRSDELRLPDSDGLLLLLGRGGWPARPKPDWVRCLLVADAVRDVQYCCGVSTWAEESERGRCSASWEGQRESQNRQGPLLTAGGAGQFP